MRKTIGLCAAATHLGGAERSLLDLARSLRERAELGYEPWVLLPRRTGPLVAALEAAGVAHDVLDVPAGFFTMSRGAPLSAFRLGLAAIPGMALYLTRLASLLARRKPALFHSNGIKCHALAAMMGPAIGVPVLWHLRDILSEGPTLWTLRALRRASGARVVANSRATAEAFAPGDPRIDVIHNGLDPRVYAGRPNRDFNAALGVPDAVPIVGVLGVLARWKGQMEFLHMAAELARRGSEARFAVVGGEIYDTRRDEGFGQQLRDEAGRLGIADRVFFSGFLADPVRAVNALDVLVHASIEPEPFGRVILEAMACGVPVVAAAAGGVLELVEDGVTGLLYTPRRTGEMAAAVTRLLAKDGPDARLRTRLAERARERFLERFTSDRHAESMARLYDRIPSCT